MKVLKKQSEKILEILKFIINYIIERQYLFYMVLPLIAMDIITRAFGYNIDFYSVTAFAPNLFTFTWIILFLGISLTFKKKIGKKIYLITNIIFAIVFLVNNVYYSMTNTFFDFNLLQSASEGAPYILDTIKNTNILVYISFIFIIYLIYKGYKKIPYETNNNYKRMIFVIIYFIILHIIAPTALGPANEKLTWSTWQNPRNNYISFNDSNKSMKISGIYEYTIRNFYITYLKTEEEQNEEDEIFLTQAFADYGEYKNKYTGIFEGKNLILIQLEGLDNWLLNENDTPTLYKMLKNSYNFTDHYSYYNGGGSTFNSEFAVNTGFITPLSYTQNAYTFNKNSFPYSLANLFKSKNYLVNAFHMNTGEYYSRSANYKNWGYNNYYGLIDIDEYSKEEELYTLDRELILNEKFNELMFPTDTNFVNYIITYSGHMPFTNSKGVCKLLYEIDTAEENNSDETTEEVSTTRIMSEEECIRRQARETDYMMELLLQNLEEKELINDTVIVVFADHYLYTIENKTLLKVYKKADNNLINKTPFFIWSKDTKQKNIKETTSQLNILPTVLNLFGMDYNPNNYIGEDALHPNYDGIVFFSDYSWYDGNVYVENGEVTNNKKISFDKLEEKNYYINHITRKNDLALKFNYFKQSKKED